MAALIRTNTNDLYRNLNKSIRLISTSQKKGDTAIVNPQQTAAAAEEEKIDFSIEAVRKSKNWVSYGFDQRDRSWDRQVMRGQMFAGVTVCLVFGGFLLAYSPDLRNVEWARREAYLTLRERERLGLPPISADYHDPRTIKLPTDEELGDRDIII